MNYLDVVFSFTVSHLDVRFLLDSETESYDNPTIFYKCKVVFTYNSNRSTKIHVENREKIHNNYFSYLHLPTQAGNYPDVDHVLEIISITKLTRKMTNGQERRCKEDWMKILNG
jgi:hypothetical protein